MVYDSLHKNVIHLEWNLAEAALATDAGREMAKEALKDDLPLHLACERRAPPSTIAALLDAYPRAASIVGRRGHLPLHLAAERNCPPPVVVSLIRSYPEALDRQDGSGRLPRDYAQRNDICREALNRPSACWIEDVEKEDYLRRVARKRTLLRQKMVQLRCAVAISAERRDRTRRAIEELEPLLRANEAYAKRHEEEVARIRDVEGRARERFEELSIRIDALGSALNKPPSGGDGSLGKMAGSSSFMTQSQEECERVVEKLTRINNDVRDFKEIVSSLTQHYDPIDSADVPGSDDGDLAGLAANIWKIDV